MQFEHIWNFCIWMILAADYVSMNLPIGKWILEMVLWLLFTMYRFFYNYELTHSPTYYYFDYVQEDVFEII